MSLECRWLQRENRANAEHNNNNIKNTTISWRLSSKPKYLSITLRVSSPSSVVWLRRQTNPTSLLFSTMILNRWSNTSTNGPDIQLKRHQWRFPPYSPYWHVTHLDHPFWVGRQVQGTQTTYICGMRSCPGSLLSYRALTPRSPPRRGSPELGWSRWISGVLSFFCACSTGRMTLWVCVGIVFVGLCWDSFCGFALG